VHYIESLEKEPDGLGLPNESQNPSWQRLNNWISTMLVFEQLDGF
jgi:hypothetical protein